jgi:hypothetical protein
MLADQNNVGKFFYTKEYAFYRKMINNQYNSQMLKKSNIIRFFFQGDC